MQSPALMQPACQYETMGSPSNFAVLSLSLNAPSVQDFPQHGESLIMSPFSGNRVGRPFLLDNAFSEVLASLAWTSYASTLHGALTLSNV